MNGQHVVARCTPTRTRASAANRAQTLAQVNATCARQDRRRMAKRIASQLVFVHHIPPFETALVPWLTEESCATNTDALAEWTHAQFSDPRLAALPGSAQLLDALSKRLHQRLNDIEDARS